MGLSIPQAPLNTQQPKQVQSLLDPASLVVRLQKLQTTLSTVPVKEDLISSLQSAIDKFVDYMKDDKTKDAASLIPQLKTLFTLFQQTDPVTFSSISADIKNTVLTRSSVSASPNISKSPLDLVSSLRSKTDASANIKDLEKIYRILIGGIENMGELLDILELVGKNGSILDKALLATIADAIKDFVVAEAHSASSPEALQGKVQDIASALRENPSALTILSLSVEDATRSAEVQQVIKQKFGDDVTISGSGEITKQGASDSPMKDPSAAPQSASKITQEDLKETQKSNEKKLQEWLGALLAPTRTSPSVSAGTAELEKSVRKISEVSGTSKSSIKVPGKEAIAAAISSGEAAKPFGETHATLASFFKQSIQEITQAKTEKALADTLKKIQTASKDSTEPKLFKVFTKSPEIRTLIKNTLKRLDKAPVILPDKVRQESVRVMRPNTYANAQKTSKGHGHAKRDRGTDAEEPFLFSPELALAGLESRLGQDESLPVQRKRKNTSDSTTPLLINLNAIQKNRVSDQDLLMITEEYPDKLADFLEKMAISRAESIVGIRFKAENPFESSPARASSAD